MGTIGEILFCVLLTVALTGAGSLWIDRLYKRRGAPLSFPNEIVARSRFRLPIIAVMIFGCTMAFISRDPFEAIYSTVLAFFLTLFIITDFEQYVIFDRMLLPFAVIGLLATIHLGMPLMDHVIAAAVGGAIFLLLTMVTRGAIGGGDVKLIAALGLWFGTMRLLDIVIFGAIAAGLVALYMVLTKKKDRKSVLAYGPYFALRALYLVLIGGLFII